MTLYIRRESSKVGLLIQLLGSSKCVADSLLYFGNSYGGGFALR